MALFFLSSAGCSKQDTVRPIVVHVFADLNASELNKALLAIGAKDLQSADGRPILIATLAGKSYTENLGLLGVQYREELVILNSSDDVRKLRMDVSLGRALRGRVATYYPAISRSASEEERRAAGVIVTNLQEQFPGI